MSTKFVYASYQEIYDLSNQSGEVTVLGIHTPSGSKVSEMMSGLFTNYRKFKYLGCELRVQPASMLPADPLQIGFEAGETLDPRDMLNPILFHGCHGDTLNGALDMIYQRGSSVIGGSSPSIDDYSVSVGEQFNRDDSGTMTMEDAYYSALSDRGWKKYGVQQPFRLKLRPMVNNVVSNMVMNCTANDDDLWHIREIEDTGLGAFEIGNFDRVKVNDGTIEGYPSKLPQFMTNKIQPLGWLPTLHIAYSANGVAWRNFGGIPKCFMGIILLPPSYKQEMYMRIVLVHRFVFSDFTSSLNHRVTASYSEDLPESATAVSLTSVEDEYSIESPSARIAQTTTGVF